MKAKNLQCRIDNQWSFKDSGRGNEIEEAGFIVTSPLTSPRFSMPIQATIHNVQSPRSGVALGGIGGGCFTLCADGTTCDWTIANNLPLGTAPLLPYEQHSILFIVIRWQEGDGHPQMRLLQIPPRLGAAGIEGHERLHTVSNASRRSSISPVAPCGFTTARCRWR